VVLEGQSEFSDARGAPNTLLENAQSLKHVLREGSLQDKTGLSIATEIESTSARLTRQLINSRNVFQTSIPIRTARDKNVRVGLDFDCAIEAASRHDQQSSIHVNTRNRRTTLRTKTLLMARRWDMERLDPRLT
jgi:hypothetical protein